MIKQYLKSLEKRVDFVVVGNYGLNYKVEGEEVYIGSVAHSIVMA